MISRKLGHSFDPVILGVFRVLFLGMDVSPNTLTVLGTAFGFFSSLAIARGYLVTGGALLVVSGLFDLMDGALARRTGRVTRFGGFFDSVLDRYSDLFVMGGILVYFLGKGSSIDVITAFVASIGIAVIPYARARAEAAGISCRAGLLERPERLLILLLGLFTGFLSYAVVILAVLTHVTVIQRIIHTRKEAVNQDSKEIRSR